MENQMWILKPTSTADLNALVLEVSCLKHGFIEPNQLSLRMWLHSLLLYCTRLVYGCLSLVQHKA